MFCGATFAASKKASKNIMENEANFNYAKISNTLIGHFYVASDYVASDLDYLIPTDWDYDTVINADFEKDINGGNITYFYDTVSYINIKRKLPNETQWKTIYHKKVTSIEDLNLITSDGNTSLVDYIEPNNTWVQYMYSPEFKEGSGQSESLLNSQIVKVKSEFDSDFMIGKNDDDKMMSYPIIINESVSYQKNVNSNVVATMGNKYPFIINNGISNYYTGHIQATMIPIVDCNIDGIGAREYRNEVDEFLVNKIPKLYKTNDGDLYIIMTGNTIPHTDNGYWYDEDENVVHMIDTQFDWTEIGNAYSMGNLYDNNIIDTDIDREAET